MKTSTFIEGQVLSLAEDSPEVREMKFKTTALAMLRRVVDLWADEQVLNCHLASSYFLDDAGNFTARLTMEVTGVSRPEWRAGMSVEQFEALKRKIQQSTNRRTT